MSERNNVFKILLLQETFDEIRRLYEYKGYYKK